VFFVVAVILIFSSCQRKLGWGILLWADESRDIPSGTVLPVYIKSNIEKKWVVGVPKKYQKKDLKETKIEIPLAQLELVGSEGGAKRRAAEFTDYALMYAETLQDGLPIRENPDNSASRVYRLRIGEIIKIIALANGAPAISTTGDPLPGEWYRVLTRDGTRGFCFSYRLSLFEHSGGPLANDMSGGETEIDPVLERVQSKVWSAEIYNNMLNERQFDIDALSKHWGFSTSEDTGIANVYTQDIDKSFRYTSIKKTGDLSWRFEGSSLTMYLLSENLLSVDFLDNDGMKKSMHFVALPTAIDDLIVQEKNRREAEYQRIYKTGPLFTSSTFGSLTLTEEADFLWEGFDLLVPDYIPISALGRGTVEVRFRMSGELAEKYDGLLVFHFKIIGGPDRSIYFLYTLGKDTEEGSLRLEYISPYNIQKNALVKQNASPMIIYFYQEE
jgi:hypothetical protein